MAKYRLNLSFDIDITADEDSEVPEEEINKILNQSILRDDTKYLIMGDNANKKLTLPNYAIGQIGSGEV